MRAPLQVLIAAVALAHASLASAQVATPAAIAAAEAKMQRAKWVHVAWSVRQKPDRINTVVGKPIREPEKIKLLRDEVSRLLRIGSAAVQGRDGPRDYSGYWCAASITFVLDDPSKPLGMESDSIEFCGRPGRFLSMESKRYPHPIKLEQPRGEIKRLLALAGIPELIDCPELAKRPGQDYDDFQTQCW
jgi:hypothetical protein